MNRPLNFLTFSVAFVLGMTVFFNPANQVLAQDTTETVKEHAMKHTDASYVCPMHSDVRSEEAGNCPLCGMHLVQVEPPQATHTVKEHAMKHTDASYVCPMHSEVRSEEAGNCPLCGMHLVQEQPVPSHDGDLGAGGEKQ